MSGLLNISEAAALAIHAVVLLAAREGHPVPTSEIAEILDASKGHLQKVLQRLTRAGYVRAQRGTKGGFVLAKPAGRIRLLDVYKAMDGPINVRQCLLAPGPCRGNRCVLGKLVWRINRDVKDFLARTKAADLVDVFRAIARQPARRRIVRGPRGPRGPKGESDGGGM